MKKFNGVYKVEEINLKKYLFNGVYVRGDWKERNAMDALEESKSKWSSTNSGNDSLASWKNINNTSNGG